VLLRDFSKPRCDERQSPGICLLGELFRITAPEPLACDDVLRTVLDPQLEASLNPVRGTGEIAVTWTPHRPERGEMFEARLAGVKESSEPIKLLFHWKTTRLSVRALLRLTNYQERRHVMALH